MSTRTIIEINHDYLDPRTLETLLHLWHSLSGSDVPKLLNESRGKPALWSWGIRILGQRHHSEPEWAQEKA